jgi:DUF1680 family protein
VGHAVRANYLYAGAADLFMETGDASVWKPLEPIWNNVTEQKLYLTGGCGALYDGASPDGAKDQKNITRVHQAYGRNYELPNITAHNETCANIGNVLWNWRMFLATGEARFMDVVGWHSQQCALRREPRWDEFLLHESTARDGPDANGIALVADARAVCKFVLLSAEPGSHHRRVSELRLWESGDAIFVNLYGGSTLTTTIGGKTVGLTRNRISVERSDSHHGQQVQR